MAKNKKYTAIGFWEEQKEPWVQAGVGLNVFEGLESALRTAMRVNGWGPEVLEKLVIVAVVEGHVQEVLGYGKLFKAPESFET